MITLARRPRRQAWVLCATAMLAVAGCAPSRSTFAFRYTSNAHVPPANRFLEISRSPQTVVQFLRNEITRNQGKILEDKHALPHIYATTANSEEAFRLSQEVARLECEHLRARDWSAYDEVDRRPGLLGSMDADVITTPGEGIDGYLLKAEVWPRPAQSEIPVVTYTGLNTTQWHANVKRFVTRVSFYVWRDRESERTKVYAEARPAVDNVEAGSGESLSIEFLQYATGEAEAKIVRSYLDLLRRADGASRASR